MISYKFGKRGFTLIELLVVIAIIAMLLSIIMPALQKVKNQAQASVCLSNVNSLIKCWMMYAQENDDRIIGSMTLTAGDPDYSWVAWPQDVNGNTVAHEDTTKEDEIRGIKMGLLYPYVDESESYHCPADKRFLDSFGNGTLGYRTYGIACGIGVCRDSEVTWMRIEPHTKYTTIRIPSNKYVFVEEGELQRGFNLNNWVFRPQDYDQIVDSLGFFHSDRSIMGFADGHGEKHKWTDPDIIDRSQAGAAGAFTVSDSDDPDMSFLRQRFTCQRAW